MTDQGALRAFDAQELAWFSEHGRAVQLLARSPLSELLIVGWRPGQQSSFHDHGDSESIVVLLCGRLSARNDSVHLELTPGQILLTPRGVKHQMTNIGDEPALTVHIYAPPVGGNPSAPFRDLSAAVPADCMPDPSWYQGERIGS
jgi:mannose-6-phosphate isomerase-like protein (cupin superfamily)